MRWQQLNFKICFSFSIITLEFRINVLNCGVIIYITLASATYLSWFGVKSLSFYNKNTKKINKNFDLNRFELNIIQVVIIKNQNYHKFENN